MNNPFILCTIRGDELIAFCFGRIIVESDIEDRGPFRILCESPLKRSSIRYFVCSRNLDMKGALITGSGLANLGKTTTEPPEDSDSWTPTGEFSADLLLTK